MDNQFRNYTKIEPQPDYSVQAQFEHFTSGHNSDIARGTWFAKWPSWIRWMLFIPIALAGCILGSVLFLLLVSVGNDFTSHSLEGGWYRLIQSGVLGALFVYIGAFIAPRYQFAIGIIMLVTAAMVLTFFATLVLQSHLESRWYEMLHVVAALVGGGIVLAYIYDETK